MTDKRFSIPCLVRSRAGSRPRRLSLQSLEERIDPAPVSWIGGNGNWNDAASWSTGLVPGPGDEVLIDPAGGAFTVSITTPQSVDSIVMAGDDLLSVTGTSLTLTQASEINGLHLSGATLNSSLLTGFTGTASIDTNSALLGSFRNEATLTTTGSIDLTDVTLDNTGTILEAGATLNLSGNVTINNPVGGVFDLTGVGDFGFLNNVAGGTLLFHNTGTLRRSGSGTASFDGVPFLNDPGATINITAGTLLVNTSGTLGVGPLAISAGAALRFGTGTDLDLSGSYSSTGAGHVDFAGGVLSLGSGTVGFNFAAGILTVSGAGATIQNGTLNNTGTIRFASGSNPTLANLTLNNSGTITDAGQIDFSGDATVNNLAGATFDASFAGDYAFVNDLAGVNNVFHNAGTLKRTGSGTASFNGVTVQNDAGAAITISAGSLLVNAPGAFSAGPFSVAAGSSLKFDATSDLTLAGNYAFTGAGHFDIVGGTYSLGSGTVGLNFPAGVMTVSGITGLFQNGTLNNTGAITVANGGAVDLANVTLNNSGTITDGGRLDFGGDATINNLAGATFDASFAGDAAFLNNFAGARNTFHNAGTLKRSGVGTARFDGVRFQNDAGASVTVTAGNLLANTTGNFLAGPLSVASGSALQFDANSDFRLGGNYGITGPGHVEMTAGTFSLGSGTVGFNFPAGALTFSGAGGTIQNGTLNNTGDIRFADASDPSLVNLVLNNSGTIANGGRIDFGGDTTVNNLAGGVFDSSYIGDNVFVNNFAGANNQFHNAGTLRRSGTGIGRFNGVTLDNTGRLEVLAGSVVLDAPVTQISGTTLSGGMWDVSSGAGLTIPGATITNSAGNVTLRGTAAAPAFDGLAANSGSLSLLEGRSLAAPGDFVNSGTVNLSPASTLTVAGGFTQSASGILGLQLGGTPFSGQFGQVVSTGPATLDGKAAFSVTGGYSPVNGDAFTLVTYPSHTGSFSGYTGLVPITGSLLSPVTAGTSFGVSILVDHVAPVSAVAAFPLATVNRPVFQVNWAGSDNVGGSGLAGYDIYVSDNGAPATVFLPGTTATTGIYTGLVGHTYSFYSRAFDLVGNCESAPATPDATIAVQQTLVPVVKSHKFTDTDGDAYTVSLTGPGTLNAVLLDPGVTGKGPLDYLIANGTTTASSITVAVTKNKLGGDGVVTIGDVTGTGALASFNAPASDLVMNGLSFTGVVKTIKVRDILNSSPLFATPVLQTGGTAKDRIKITARHVAGGVAVTTPETITSLTAADIGAGTITAAGLAALRTTAGGMADNLQITGAVGPVTVAGPASGTWNATSFGVISVTGGALSSAVTSLGAVSRITIKGGGFSGTATARNLGAVSVTGGDFSGQLVSLTPAATLKTTPALASLLVNTGDLTGAVRLLGRSGAITVTASKLGVGGNILGATINAGAIGNLTVGRNFTDSIILAGADLGADHEFGGGNDVFAAGTLGAVKIGGSVTGSRSLLGAGFSRIGLVDSLIGEKASSITSLTVTGAADAGLHFAAGLFKGSPKIGGVIVNPHTDSRFLTV